MTKKDLGNELPTKQDTQAARPALREVAKGSIVENRQSFLEKQYGQFWDDTIATAGGPHNGAGQLMNEMNRIHSMCAGLGTVLRIVVGNSVVQDFFDPEDNETEVPLSRVAINNLTTLAAEICEMISDDISSTSDRFNGQVKS